MHGYSLFFVHQLSSPHNQLTRFEAPVSDGFVCRLACACFPLVGWLATHARLKLFSLCFHLVLALGFHGRREDREGEKRVALTPEMAKKLRRELGFRVLVQKGAGKEAACSDDKYQQAACVLVESAAEVWAESDIVLRVSLIISY